MNHTNSQQSHITDRSSYPVDIEKLLRDGHPIRLKPQGYSMYPLFISGRDEAVIAPCSTDSLHRGDVVLYRRDQSILVLHRIWKIKKDGFYMVGDNQTVIEGPLRPDQIRGRLIACCRNGREFRLLVSFSPLPSTCSQSRRLFPPYQEMTHMKKTLSPQSV